MGFIKKYKEVIRYVRFLYKYALWLEDIKRNKSHFVPITKEQYNRKEGDTKIFAYYLTQFHAIPENDEMHGKGFTEWDNVASCFPHFIGEYQPKLPFDLGFYNLLQPGVMERQAELARMYGVYGFCFYYYWFSGRKVLEKPLEYWLKSDIDLHYHFCWANENWSKLWDGGDKEVFLEQKIEEGDAERFFEDILPYIKDPRYEKIGNKPILMIYRPTLIEKERFKNFVSTINKLAAENGFDGFFLTASNFDESFTPSEWGIDAVTEFPPHGFPEFAEEHRMRLLNTTNYHIKSLSEYIQRQMYLEKKDYPVFKTCFPSWDNLPRKAWSNGVCFLLSEEEFSLWLNGIIKWTKENNTPEKQYVYINAWNEWGEGAILEPTQRYGYKYLQIVKDCLEGICH